MAAILGTMDLDDFIKRYKAGEGLNALSREAHVDQRTARRVLTAHGIQLRTIAEIRSTPIDMQSVIRRYQSGESTAAIARDAGLTEGTIVRRLRKSGIPIRTGSENMALRWKSATPAERRQHGNRMAVINRGRVNAPTSFERAALTIEKNGSRISPLERLMAEWLTARGHEVRHQVAVSRYNIDLVIGSVAVEIFGGSWHASPTRLRQFNERSKYLFDRGWSVVVVWHHATDYPISERAADAVSNFIHHRHAFSDIAGSGPPVPGEYRVIRGDGECVAIGRYDGNDIPVVTASRRRLNG